MNFGLTPPEGTKFKYWWGWRTIYEPPGRELETKRSRGKVIPAHFDFVPDRGGSNEAIRESTETYQKMLNWINAFAIPALREWCAKNHVSRNSDSGTFVFDDGTGWQFQASTRSSGGYMYMGCWDAPKPFISFNKDRPPEACVPTTEIEIPNGYSALSLRTSNGKRLTLLFTPYKKDAPPSCVDIRYHDSGVVNMNGQDDLGAIQVLGFRVGGSFTFDTREILDRKTLEPEPTSMVCVLLEDSEYAKLPKVKPKKKK